MKNKRFKQIFMLLIGALFLLMAACSPAGGNEPTIEENGEGETLTMYVGAETADCVGVGPQTCLLIKFEPAAEWQFFYDSIEGFEYEPGFEYELLVEKFDVENPPADASSIRYVLKEVVHKIAIEAEQPIEGEPIPSESLGGNWNLVSFGPEGSETAVLPDTIITADFTQDSVAGSAGCNTYNGSYFMNANLITFDPIVTTLMACMEEISAQEAAYLALLQNAESVTQMPEQLIIHAPEGNLIFEPAVDAELEGTEWHLSGILQGEGVVTMAIDEPIMMTLAEGTVNGNAGCNSFFGSYTVNGQTLMFDSMGNTEMACAEEIMARESEFLSAMMQVESFEITRNRLSLMDADGKAIIFFTTK